jgi:phosphatidate phosphatase
LVLVGFPIWFYYLFGVPYERGFFCDDESLIHPFHDSTVTSATLYSTGLLVPLISISVIEFFRWKFNMDERREVKLFGYEIPFWVQNVYKYAGLVFFGAACSHLTTDIGKYAIGRLRPHFMTRCMPVFPDGTNCSNPINLHKYMEKFTCTNPIITPRKLKEMRLSFPSGHSSFSTYTMVFAALYLQARFNWKGSKLVKHFFQFIFLAMAWYVAMSRISDYKHHCE